MSDQTSKAQGAAQAFQERAQIFFESHPKLALMASFLLGGLTILSFAPFLLWWLAFFTLAGLFYLLSFARPMAAAKIGFVFGLGLYLFGVSWVYISLSTYGGMPLWMGSIAVLGFASILSCFTAMVGWLAAWLAPQGSLKRCFALAILWPLFEWQKSWVLTGFPWLDIGYTQIPTWLSAWAPIGGVYLVSFSVVVFSLCLSLLGRRFRLASMVLLALVASSYLLNAYQWVEDSGEPLSIGVVQGNIPIEKKWPAQYRQGVIQHYRTLSQRLANKGKLDLIVLPETALPLYFQQTDQAFWQNFAPDNTAVLAGVLDNVYSEQVDQSVVYNAAVLACDGQAQVYRKRHLVPFGEYMPLRFVFGWVLDYLQLPMSDMGAWQGEQELKCQNGLNVGLSICYEDAFSGELQRHSGDAGILVNISEDAWFGDSLAPHQRQQMAQMRARELARPMVRSANSGPSTFIDHLGRIQKVTPQFESAMMSHAVQAKQGDTPFKRYGEWFAYCCLLILMGLIGMRLRLAKE